MIESSSNREKSRDSSVRSKRMAYMYQRRRVMRVPKHLAMQSVVYLFHREKIQKRDMVRSHPLHPLLFLPVLLVIVSPPASLTTPIPSTATLVSCTVPPNFLIICSLALAAPGDSQPNV